ncbi:hypothetical protein [Sphingomonas sp. G-3-2-10]|uniref:hypothetical protein n=1 Tax=Sphingomonas sp. G-3-2-10 TaxID=2728838 RepID=UPI00146A4390|nr:hypothetical protein [Sphingomonas sp. G-3-2-10]NML05065.1 hypothetical protein [Sphingomonas sp. G-3-2-10]
MMRKLFPMLVIGGVVAIAQPAAAQSVSTSNYKAALDYSECVVTKDAAAARALLAATPESTEAKAAASALSATGCDGSRIRQEALRGAIAERVYLATHATAPAELTGEPPAFTGSGVKELAYYDIGRCTASRDPLGVDMLVRSDLRSDAEKAALKRIMPVLAGCVPSGFQLGLDREKLRGYVAEGLLQVRGAAGAN